MRKKGFYAVEPLYGKKKDNTWLKNSWALALLLILIAGYVYKVARDQKKEESPEGQVQQTQLQTAVPEQHASAPDKQERSTDIVEEGDALKMEEPVQEKEQQIVAPVQETSIRELPEETTETREVVPVEVKQGEQKVLSAAVVVKRTSTDEEPEKTTEEENEKTALQNSVFFGDYRNARIEEVSGKTTLEIWPSYILVNLVKTLKEDGKIKDLSKQELVNVEYDEVWTMENTKFLTQSEIEEKRQSGGWFVHGKLYWKDNKIQASTIEKPFTEDPRSRETFPQPVYKIVEIYDRDFILKKLAEDQ